MQGRNIALIGARSAGKSKVSRRVGKVSGRSVFSTDTLISYEAGGQSIARIVATEGWPGFREREFRILQKLCAMRDVVIDCGGGILVEAPDENAGQPEEFFSRRKAELLKGSSEVVYVKRPLSWLLDRARRDANRPDLIGDYERVLERRLPWYEQTADFILDLGDGSATDGADRLVERYGRLDEG